MANSKDFDARYELREFPFANGADGEPTPESLAALDAIGFGFHEPTPKPEARKRKVNELIADEAVLLGAYVRKPQPARRLSIPSDGLFQALSVALLRRRAQVPSRERRVRPGR